MNVPGSAAIWTVFVSVPLAGIVSSVVSVFFSGSELSGKMTESSALNTSFARISRSFRFSRVTVTLTGTFSSLIAGGCCIVTVSPPSVPELQTYAQTVPVRNKTNKKERKGFILVGGKIILS